MYLRRVARQTTTCTSTTENPLQAAQGGKKQTNPTDAKPSQISPPPGKKNNNSLNDHVAPEPTPGRDQPTINTAAEKQKKPQSSEKKDKISSAARFDPTTSVYSDIHTCI